MVDQPRLDGHDTHHAKVWYDEDWATRYRVISIKASEGTTFRDPQFAHRWQVLRARNVPYRCAYAWPLPNKPIEPQVRLLQSQIDNQGGLQQGEFTMCDVEETVSLRPNGFLSLAQVEEWQALVEQIWPGRNCNYLNASWPHMAAWRAKYPDYPLWYAHWPTLADPISLGRAWAKVNAYKAVLWQFTNRAVVSGITYPVDGDMIVDEDRLKQLAGYDVVPTPTPSPQPTPGEHMQIRLITLAEANAAFFAESTEGGVVLRCEWTGDGSTEKVKERIRQHRAAGMTDLKPDMTDLLNISLDGFLPSGDTLHTWTGEEFANTEEIRAFMAQANASQKISELANVIAGMKLNLREAGE